MASIHEEIHVHADAATVWAVVCNYGAVQDLVPGFVVATELEPGAVPPVRIVTFASGIVLRETIVACDDATRRLVWTIDDATVAHHNGALQVTTDGSGCRVAWTADVLPDSLVEAFQPLMVAGLATTARHFGRAAS